MKSGRKAEAKELSDKGEQQRKLMDEANQKASDAVFHEKNTGRDDHTIDLNVRPISRSAALLQKSVPCCLHVCIGAQTCSASHSSLTGI